MRKKSVVQNFVYFVLNNRFIWVFSLFIALTHNHNLSASANEERPGAKELNLTAGEWNIFTEFWKEPGTLAITSKGTAKIEKSGDNQFREKCSRKEKDGSEIKSDVTILFDKKKNEHSLVLKDSLESFGEIDIDMAGQFDQKSKSYTFTGKLGQEASKSVPVRLVIKNIKPDGFKKELWIARRDGREAKIFEVKYYR